MKIVENTPLRLRFVDTIPYRAAMYVALFGIVPSAVVALVNLAPRGNPDRVQDALRGLAVVWGALVVLYLLIHLSSISRRSATFDASAGELRITDRLGRVRRTIRLTNIDEPYLETDLRRGGLFYRFGVRLTDGEKVCLSKRWNKDEKRFTQGEVAILQFLHKPLRAEQLVSRRAPKERERCAFCTRMENYGCAVIVDVTSPDGQQADVFIVPRCFRCETLHSGLFPGIGLAGGLALTVAAGMAMHPHVHLVVLIVVLPFLFFGLSVGGAFLMQWMFKPSHFGIPDVVACFEDPQIAALRQQGWSAIVRRPDLSD